MIWNLLLGLLKKKEAWIGLAFLVMGSLIYVQDLKLKNMELRLDKAETALESSQTSLNTCRDIVRKNNDVIAQMKTDADMRQGKINTLNKRAENAEKQSIRKNNELISQMSKAKTCNEAMNRFIGEFK